MRDPTVLEVDVFHQPNHAHRNYDPEARSREGSLLSYALGMVVAGGLVLGVYLLLRALLSIRERLGPRSLGADRQPDATSGQR